MQSYDVLNKLQPEAFLDASNFLTENDHLPEDGYAEKQYRSGLGYGLDANFAFVTGGGTWACQMKDGSIVTSCEGIGYHACTADLWQGFLDSGCEIRVIRLGGRAGATVIKTADPLAAYADVIRRDLADRAAGRQDPREPGFHQTRFSKAYEAVKGREALDAFHSDYDDHHACQAEQHADERWRIENENARFEY